MDIFTEEHYKYYEDNYASKKFIAYIMDRRYRKAVNVSSWIKPQVNNASEDLKAIALEETKKYRNDDTKALALLRYIKRNITYTSDHKVWGVTEKWQTAQETFDLKTGDCEDGAILLYVLCRLSGIPVYKLKLVAGDVVGGGHCWLMYRSQPHWGVFLDWCYWYSGTSVSSRPVFYINDKEIKGEDERYKTMWFAFDENHSIISYNLRKND